MIVAVEPAGYLDAATSLRDANRATADLHGRLVSGLAATLGRLTERSGANHADAERRSILPGRVIPQPCRDRRPELHRRRRGKRHDVAPARMTAGLWRTGRAAADTRAGFTT